METWVYIVVLIVSAVLQYALAPKPVAPKPASLEDFEVPQVNEGSAIGVAFGNVVIKSATLAWYGDLSSQAIKKKPK